MVAYCSLTACYCLCIHVCVLVCTLAFEQSGVVPDIVTMGKPFGNGMPLAAVVCTAAIGACVRACVFVSLCLHAYLFMSLCLSCGCYVVCPRMCGCLATLVRAVTHVAVHV